MDGPSDWVSQLVSENVELKQQVRIMRENLELRKILEEGSKEMQGREFMPLKASVYPKTCDPKGTRFPMDSPVQRRRMSKLLEAQDCPPSSSLDDLLSSPCGTNSGESAFHSSGVSSRTLYTSDLFTPQSPEHKPSLRSSEAEDITIERPLLNTEERCKGKKVWFSEASLPIGCRSKRCQIYYMDDVPGFHSEKEGRVVGEIAFQLDRRILAHVFPGATRLYGFTVSNIAEKIIQSSRKPMDGSMDEQKRRDMSQQYLSIMCQLQKLGYSRDVHPIFSEFLVNTYGILKQRELRTNPLHSHPVSLRKMVIDIVPAKFLRDTLLLLNCLCELSREDGKPLFAW